MKIIISLVLLLAFPYVQATPTKCVGSYKVAVNESEPLYFRDMKTNQIAGVSHDTLEELSKRTSCKFTPVLMNRSRLLTEFRSHRVDLIVVTIKNPVFDELGVFVPIEEVPREAVLSSETSAKYTQFEDLLKDPKRNFIVLPAASYFFKKEEIEQLSKQGRFITAPSLQESYRLLQKNSMAAIVQNDFIHDYFSNSQVNFIRIVDSKNRFPIGIYYRHAGNQNDLESIGQALSEMVTDGTWKKIAERYSNYNRLKEEK